MKKNELPGEKSARSTDTEKASDTSADNKSISEKEAENKDYWERIAEDPASGYKTEGNNDPLLNIDQQPGDAKKGDEAE